MFDIKGNNVRQRFILKLHTSQLVKAKWNLVLPLRKAREDGNIVTLSDSEVLSYIDELNELVDANEQASRIKKEIRKTRREENTVDNRKKLKALYAQLDDVQFVPDYLCLIIDRVQDYRRAIEGFTVNGIFYKRLLGTNGGVKKSTIVFVSDKVKPELDIRLENGRNLDKPLVPAKYESYKALSCTGSTPVSFPKEDDQCKGIIVVEGCITHFTSDVLSVNDEQDGEPVMEFQPNAEIELEESDGYGIMLPSLAEKWSEELKLGYTTCGMNTRFSFEKGMVFTFDFIDFAENVANTYYVTDAWGGKRDVRNASLILTTSMVKLWDSYDSCESYVSNSIKNRHTFRISKVCPETLEHERNLNYQFIQSYHLTDEQIDELISPTMQEIDEVLTGDWVKAVLFAKGTYMNEQNAKYINDDFFKALMIDKRIYSDSHVKSKLYQMIRKRIDRAKIGVLKVHGNYSVVSGDPYALCQHIFGMIVTGLLPANHIYNKYWVDEGTEKVACFRAPMTWHGNIRLMKIARTEEMQYWYRYMDTCTILNAWDTTAHALNGCDKDLSPVLVMMQ